MTKSDGFGPFQRAAALVAFALTAIAGSATVGHAADSPIVTFEPRAVVIAGLAPNAKVLLFGIANEEYRYPRRISQKASLFTAGPDGVFRLDLSNQIPSTSVWVAADLETGEYIVAGPPELKLKKSTIPASALKARGDGSRARLEIDDDDQELLYVRPRVGAWRLSGGRLLELESLTPVDDSPEPPGDFEAGDVLVTVNPFSLVVRTFRVR